MTKEQIFMVLYLDHEENEIEVPIEAKTHVEASEIAESEDPDLGSILFVGTEKEYEEYKSAVESSYVVQYLNYEEQEKEFRTKAYSPVQASEIAESEDPDLGQILFVGTEEEYQSHKDLIQKKAEKKHKFENSLSI